MHINIFYSDPHMSDRYEMTFSKTLLIQIFLKLFLKLMQLVEKNHAATSIRITSVKIK